MLNALLPALLLGVSAAGNPASADLTYARAELVTPAGAQAVYTRIESLAEHVCAEENRNAVMAANATRICIADTVERAVVQIAAPQLTQIHAARSISPDGRDRVVLAAARD